MWATSVPRVPESPEPTTRIISAALCREAVDMHGNWPRSRPGKRYMPQPNYIPVETRRLPESGDIVGSGA
jgi:hypothetical protein